LLALAGLSLLCTTLGCQLSVTDVVRRSPDVGSGRSGPSAQDARDANPAANDSGPLIGLRIDGDYAVYDAFVMGENEAETGLKLDATDTRPPASPAHADAVSEAGGAPMDSESCTDAGYQFCEGFEDGAARWALTGGPWDLSNVSDGSGTNTVFGPTAAVAGIAFVPGGSWQDMTVEARVMVTSFDQATSTNRVLLYARYQDSQHFYAVALRGDGKLALRRNAAAFGTVASVALDENHWHTLKLSVSGSADNVVVEGSLDGTLLVTAMDSSDAQASDLGTVGVGVYGGALAVFDDIHVSSP
jgi:hypothetical protein